MRIIRVDLRRLENFSQLASGTYILTVKAIGSGINTDSNRSSGTVYIKQE